MIQDESVFSVVSKSHVETHLRIGIARSGSVQSQNEKPAPW